MVIDPILRTCSLEKKFGGVVAVNNCSLEAQERSILGIIGPNGAGKTTFLNLITGVYKPDAGDVYFRNERITNLKAHKIARKGVARMFQISRVFANMTSLENMLVPFSPSPRSGKKNVDKAMELLEHFELVNLRNEYAKTLSGGQQRLLELARLLMLDPELVLLDEPFAGVHPKMQEKVINYIKELHKKGKTIILISHDIPNVMTVCQEVVVFNQGTIIARGKPEEIRHDEKVIEAYLGV